MRSLTDEEYTIASRFLFLSMTIVVIRQDISHVKNGLFKIKEPYLKHLKEMESQALEECGELRKIMNKRKIDVVTLNRNDSFSSFLFLCQDREEKRNFFNPSIRKKVEAILDEYFFKALQAAQTQADSLYT